MVSSEFRKNIQAGDLFSVKSALIDYLIVDRTFVKFDEALAFASKEMDVLVPFDGNALQEDATSWDENYLNLAKVGLLNNFSRERIDHLKTVIRAVMPTGQPESAFAFACQSAEDIPTRPGRTGREVLEEETPRAEEPDGERAGRESRTGREVIFEEEKAGSVRVKAGVGSAMIVGGAAVAACGLLAEEALMIGAGVIVAGVGCAIAFTK